MFIFFCIVRRVCSWNVALPYGSAAMAPRSKQTIPLETLKQLGKATLKEPMANHYLSEDIAVVVSTHKEFLVAVGPYTKRLNPCSVALMAKDLFQLGHREAQLFGDSMAHAYGHCMTAGAKATTGQKLPKEVLAVYHASFGGGACGREIKQEGVKREAGLAAGVQARGWIAGGAGVKREAGFKLEEQSCSPPPSKSLKKCLSSPSQIVSLYAGNSSSSNVKVTHLCGHDKHKHPGGI